MLPDASYLGYSFRLWQMDDGLPGDNVQAIAQSSDGYLWIGTRWGLARFDGLKFKTFTRGNSLLPVDDVTCLGADQDGSLWIGTIKGIVRYKAGTFSLGDEKLSALKINTVFSASDKTVWLGTSSGLWRKQDETWHQMDSTKDMAIFSIVQGNQDQLFLATSQGLKVLQNELITGVEGRETFAGAVRTLCLDRSGTLWISHRSDLWRIPKNIKSPARVETSLSHNLVSAMIEDRSEKFWVATHGGLNQWDRTHNAFIEIKRGEEPFDVVNAIYEDREGNIWVGDKQGLTCLRPNYFFTYTTKHGLSHNIVASVLEDSTGSIWIGTAGGGLNQITKGESFARNVVTSNTLATALCEPLAGQLLYGEDNGKLRLVKSENVKTLQQIRSRWFEIIRQDQDGKFWIGSSSGLWVYDGKTTSPVLTESQIHDVWPDQKRNLWVASEAGLFLASNVSSSLKPDFKKIAGLRSDSVKCLYEDGAGKLWVGTSGGLSCHFGNKTVNFDTSRGLFDHAVLGILEDDYQQLWLGSLKGIYSVDKRELNASFADNRKKVHGVYYGKDEGMASTRCTDMAKPSAWKSRDGRLWFTTHKGLSVIDPKNARSMNEAPPLVAIEEVMADKKPIGNQMSDSITLSPGRGDLEFRFAALSFVAPEKNQFKYKLEGLDSDWIDAGTYREAFYNNVPPGDYTFRVIACNNDGVWDSLGSSTKLRLLPHFWQTWWFQACVILTGAGSVGIAARYITRRRLEFSLKRLEQQHAIEKERTRIARDMHDDFGARLTEILLLTRRARQEKHSGDAVGKHSSSIESATNELIDNLHAIVWAINPKNDSLDNLVSYLQTRMPAFLKLSSIRCRFDIPDDLPQLPLPSDVRHHLFLAIKEALHNVVKHAKATEVWLRIAVEDSRLCLIVEDNGIGFELGEAASCGNGLENMRKRLIAVGGTGTICSAPGQGTRILFTLPLASKNKPA